MRFLIDIVRAHIDAQSPLVIRHHQNWRSRTLNQIENLSQRDLVFTGPLTVGQADAERVRNILLRTISDISKIVEDSPPEEVIYFGVDWIHN